jgi:CDP-glucose 4,6-dehydratase
MHPFCDQYAGRRVFITGHTGFKGFWLSSWLLELGAVPCGFAIDVPTDPSGFEALKLRERMTHVQGDIRDREALARAMSEFQPDVVFHMAAQALVRPSYEDPASTFETNAMGTLNVLEAVRHAPSVRALVLITSDKCYRNNEWVWGYRESDTLGGNDPYSASKACAEIIAHAYFASFFSGGQRMAPARMATVRAGNVIGGGDWAEDRIVPDCARAFAAGQAVTLRNPQATRPWQHVLEPLSGYLWLGAKLLREAQGDAGADAKSCHGESFNFGPPVDVNATVREVAEALAAHWPGFRVTSAPEASGKHESTLLKLCCDKALACLDWKPTLNLAESLRLTAEWYREYYSLSGKADSADDMRMLTARQIAAYTHTATERGLAWTR